MRHGLYILACRLPSLKLGRRAEVEDAVRLAIAVSAKSLQVASTGTTAEAVPSGLLLAGFGGVFLAMVPATLKLAEPGGRVQLAVNFFVRFLVGADVPANRMIPALAAVYSFFTYALTGAASAAGSAAASAGGFDNSRK